MSTRAPAPAHVNEIRLLGRVAAAAQTRILPSGDEIATLRVVVDRPRREARHDSGPERGGTVVDTFEVSCWTARSRRRALALGPGDVVLVEGTLRRRFYRTPDGAASRYEVHADTLRRQWRPTPVS